MTDLAEAYRACLSGKSKPANFLCRHGYFTRDPDGNVNVYAFDGHGNHFALSKKEQARRIEALRQDLETFASPTP